MERAVGAGRGLVIVDGTPLAVLVAVVVVLVLLLVLVAAGREGVGRGRGASVVRRGGGGGGCLRCLAVDEDALDDKVADCLGGELSSLLKKSSEELILILILMMMMMMMRMYNDRSYCDDSHSDRNCLLWKETSLLIQSTRGG